jgi:hypothetical protein
MDHDHMPQPEEAQRLIEEHISTLGEQKAQLNALWVTYRGRQAGKARPQVVAAEPASGKAGRLRTPVAPAAVNAPREEPAAEK